MKYDFLRNCSGHINGKAYFSVQLSTNCAVVKLKCAVYLYNFCIVNWPIARFCAVVNPA